MRKQNGAAAAYAATARFCYKENADKFAAFVQLFFIAADTDIAAAPIKSIVPPIR